MTVALVKMRIVVPSSLPRTLRAIRVWQGWGVRRAAKIAGISTATFSRVENGKLPDVPGLIALSAFCSAWARRKQGGRSR